MELSSKDLAETAIKMLGDRWKMQIIECLMDGTKRFGELKKELGSITQKVLTSNLRMLEENGIITRHIYAEIPPRVDYTLTKVGYNLRPVIDSMVAWAEIYQATLVQGLEDGKLKIEEKRNILGSSFEYGKTQFEKTLTTTKNKLEEKRRYISSNLEYGKAQFEKTLTTTKNKLEEHINKIKQSF